MISLFSSVASLRIKISVCCDYGRTFKEFQSWAPSAIGADPWAYRVFETHEKLWGSRMEGAWFW